MALNIKSKLVAVDDKIATIEQEFLSYLVLANGKTIYEGMKPALEEAKQGNSQLMLPASR